MAKKLRPYADSKAKTIRW